MSGVEESKKLGERLVKHDVISQEELKEVEAREKSSGIPIYRQLLQMGKVSAAAVEDLMRTEFHPKERHETHRNLGKVLLEENLATQEQLDRALKIQKRNGRLLGNILVDEGIVDKATMLDVLSEQHGIEYIDFDESASDPEALEAVPIHIARKHEFIPLKIEEDRISVLIDHPQHADQLTGASVILSKRLHPIVTCMDDLKEELAKRYKGIEPEHPAEPPKTQTKSTQKPAAKKDTSTKKTEKPSKKNKENELVSDTTGEIKAVAGRFDAIAKQSSGVPVIKVVQTMIEGAINAGATDVHLDPQEPEMRVRFRIDGILHDVMSIPSDIESATVSRIKIMADLDITETRHPQDGHITMDINDDEFDLRVATLPTFLGERIVIRILDQSSVLSGVRDIGLEKDDEEKLIRLISQPYGMVLVTGPTGSGKTTTLYASLNQKNVMTDSIVTLEDPVEYQLTGINQVQIDPDIDLTFAQTLRAAMRQDIDVLLVGEIRDPETARIAIRAAMTGHLVFSTLHTNDAPEAISTLRNMDVPSYLIESALTAVIGQRLIRRICPDCKKSFKPSAQLLKSIGLPASVKKLYRGEGCETCYGTGNKGRIGIFEILEVTAEVREMIASEAPPNEIAKKVGLTTMADRCRKKVRDGIAEPEEFLRVIRT